MQSRNDPSTFVRLLSAPQPQDAEAAVRIYQWKCRKNGLMDRNVGLLSEEHVHNQRMDLLQQVSELFIAFPTTEGGSGSATYNGSASGTVTLTANQRRSIPIPNGRRGRAATTRAVYRYRKCTYRA